MRFLFTETEQKGL